ncbi:prepilin-type N-terminal cleavage/methylation domain-containing protein [Lentisphaera profundi]|uniref:Prepilin-type N-terminal cleavage/methylation domain-containing protein n=1 Tax=Lentisphaera profundi TaxID=1658616 RepID=A0ABY7VS21_9BACT|nr:prepilin-type N-terminal cleavage/methylation domain-containing protein [Lentisphaera profundi]WDE96517.1 prepilin-type N-terminal cleavage/methylation domain-containing protein [Lentisphaera profundi]
MKKFTLIELLVVIAIIGILASLLLPVLGKARKKAQASVCKNKLKQISMAAFMYSEDFDDYGPLTENFDPWAKKLSTQAYLPELNTSNKNGIYRCPNGADMTNYSTNNYSMNWRLGHDNGSSVQEGYHANLKLSSNHAADTIFFIDSYNNSSTIWYANLADESKVYYSDESLRIARHQGKANLVFIDGHVESKSGAQLLNMGAEPWASDLWTP